MGRGSARLDTLVAQHRDSAFCWRRYATTNTLPPALAALNPQEVYYYSPTVLRDFKDEPQIAVVRIKIFGMHSTGGTFNALLRVGGCFRRRRRELQAEAESRRCLWQWLSKLQSRRKIHGGAVTNISLDLRRGRIAVLLKGSDSVEESHFAVSFSGGVAQIGGGPVLIDSVGNIKVGHGNAIVTLTNGGFPIVLTDEEELDSLSGRKEKMKTFPPELRIFAGPAETSHHMRRDDNYVEQANSASPRF